MISEHKSRSNFWAAVSLVPVFVFMLVGLLGLRPPTSLGVICLMLLYLGWLLAFCYYAAAKGYPTLRGLLWLLGCVGLLVLMLLPDKSNAPKPQPPPVQPRTPSFGKILR
jgi:hypothetical protein